MSFLYKKLDFWILGGMLFLAIVLPLSTKLVNQNQDERSRAAEESQAVLNFKFAFKGIGPSSPCLENIGKLELQVVNVPTGISQSDIAADFKPVEGEINNNGDQIFEVSNLILDSKFNSVGSINAIRIKGPFHLATVFCTNGQTEKMSNFGECDINLKNGTVYDFSQYPLISGDINQDKMVNGIDFSILKLNTGGSGDVVCSQKGDLNDDGVVNSIDVELVKRSLSLSDEEIPVGSNSSILTPTLVPTLIPTSVSTPAVSNKIIMTKNEMVTFKTMGGKEVYPVIDLLVAVNSSIKGDQSKIEQMIRDIKNMGFTKIYLVVIPEGTPSLGWSGIKPVPDGYSYQYWETAMKNTGGDINKAFLDACHKYGMETIAIYKPYEGGGGTSYPSSKTTAYANYLTDKTSVNTVGGKRTYFTRFISKNTDLRLKRKENLTEENDAKLGINKVTMSFYNDSLDLSKISLNDLNQLDGNKPRLWVSTDNGEYFVYTDFSYNYKYENNYRVYDINGFDTGQSKSVITLTLNINSLPQEYRYVAVTFHSTHLFQRDQNSSYLTFPNSMLKLYHDNTLIPSSAAYYVRKPINLTDTPENHVWGNETTPVQSNEIKGIDKATFADGKGKVRELEATAKTNSSLNGAEQFYKWGFEFGYKTSNISVTAGINSSIYGLGAGKDEYAPGLLCEGYDSVRSYWLSEVKRFLDMGYDGIDIRTTSHSANMTDYAYYGYNEPIAAVYLNKYKVTLESEPINYVVARRIAEIRGEFFLQFLEQASNLIHKYNKTLLTDVYATAYETYNSNDVTTYRLKEGLNEFFYWFNSKMIVQNWNRLVDLSDGIVFKDVFLPDYSRANQEIGKNLLSYAQNKGKSVSVHCYTGQGNSDCPASFYNEVDSSKANSVLVYELINYDSKYETVKNNLKQIAKNVYQYKIDENKISGIKTNTTVESLIKNLNMMGTFVILDENGGFTPKTGIVKDRMKLMVNGKDTYTLVVK